VFLAFDHTGTGDQRQRLARANERRANKRQCAQSACVYCSDRVR
jgi:hypothetical protein